MKSRIKRKNLKYRRLEKENQKYQEMVIELQNKIKYDEYLKKENKKLVEWIQKILEQFGTFDVHSRERIQIPTMRNIDRWSNGIDNKIITNETIIIPEIAISKVVIGSDKE